MELLTRRLLVVYFKDWEVKYNHRPDWLKNEKTGKNLELDIYYPEHLLAVEVNGIQHKLGENQRRDHFKSQVCRSRGITLLQINKYTRILQIKEKLENYFSSGRACWGYLQASHIFPEGIYHSMKFDPENMPGMCTQHHIYWWHENPLDAHNWLRKYLGEERYNYLFRLRDAYKEKQWFENELTELIAQAKQDLLGYGKLYEPHRPSL
jgi:Protein of unknown function (DUF2726)